MHSKHDFIIEHYTPNLSGERHIKFVNVLACFFLLVSVHVSACLHTWKLISILTWRSYCFWCRRFISLPVSINVFSTFCNTFDLYKIIHINKILEKYTTNNQHIWEYSEIPQDFIISQNSLGQVMKETKRGWICTNNRGKKMNWIYNYSNSTCIALSGETRMNCT